MAAVCSYKFISVHETLIQTNLVIHTTESKHWLKKIKGTEEPITPILAENPGNKKPGRNPADVKSLNCQLKASF